MTYLEQVGAPSLVILLSIGTTLAHSVDASELLKVFLDLLLLVGVGVRFSKALDVG